MTRYHEDAITASPRVAPIRVAYADPPYPGCARFYSRHGTPEFHPDAMRWDDPDEHVRLMQDLERDYPDGWALSTSSIAVRELLHRSPDGARLAAYCHAGVQNAMCGNVVAAISYMWEGVIYRVPHEGRGIRVSTPDCVWASAGWQNTPDFYGSKPAKFCRWLFGLLRLGAHADDELVDLFPGSGMVTRAWQEFKVGPIKSGSATQGSLFEGAHP